MTTAIEQAKREMYEKLAFLQSNCDRPNLLAMFDSSLEAYLEQLRQQYEEMASTAHSRFESIQSLEAANQTLNGVIEKLSNSVESRGEIIVTLDERLIKMTESRDMFRNLHQAATHASIERVGQASTSGQTSGDRASCEQSGAKKVAIDWDGEGLPPVGMVCEHSSSENKLNDKDGEWFQVKVVAHHVFGDDEYECAVWAREYEISYSSEGEHFRPIRTQDQIAAEEREKAISEMKYVFDSVSDELMPTSNKYLETLFGAIHDAGYRKPSCMHSFFAIGSDQMKCTFCGVGK